MRNDVDAQSRPGKGGVVLPRQHRWKPGQSGHPAGRHRRAAWTKRAAAERVLRTLEAWDLADYQPVIDGEKTLAELRAAGVNTEVVKRLKPTEHGVEIELHDRAGAELDRILDRTDG